MSPQRRRNLIWPDALKFPFVNNEPPGHPGESTHYFGWGEPVIKCGGYRVTSFGLKYGECPACGTEIPTE